MSTPYGAAGARADVSVKAGAQACVANAVASLGGFSDLINRGGIVVLTLPAAREPASFGIRAFAIMDPEHPTPIRAVPIPPEIRALCE